MIGRLSFRGRFTLTAIAALIGAAIIGWSAMDIIAEVLRPIVELGLRMLGFAQAAALDESGNWAIRSVHRTAETGQDFVMTIGSEKHVYVLRSLPIFIALMLAPPYDRNLYKGIAIGILALLGIAVLSMIAIVNGYVLVAINRESPFTDIPVPPFTVAAPAAHELWAEISFGMHYAALMVLPLIAPVVIWVWMKPKALRQLMRPDADQR